MFDYGRIVRVAREELGEVGAESLSDAINFCLANAENSHFGCWEEQIILYSLLLAFDCDNLNLILPEFCALRGKRREFFDLKQEVTP